jgi:hypothetical protein
MRELRRAILWLGECGDVWCWMGALVLGASPCDGLGVRWENVGD